MKKKTIVIASSIVIIIAASIIAGYFLFRPTPIVKDVNETHVGWIEYNADGSGDLISIKNYDEEAILNYLSTCMERRTIEMSGNYLLGNVKIRILLRTENGVKEILLGDINYSSFGSGTLKHEIQNAEEVKVTLLKMLHLNWI